MKITQLANALNGTLSTVGIIDQVTGAQAVATEDLSNIVDIGKTVLDYTGQSNENFDSFIRSLIDHVGRVMFVDRTYASQAPNILMDSWEYGSIMEKVRCEVPDVRDNATWDLFNYPKGGTDKYPDPFELSKPTAQAKFYNSKATYEVPITIAETQLKEAFQSAAQLGSFISMIENRIRMKMTLCNDALIMATIANLIGQKVKNGKAINLVTLYNAIAPAGATVTAATALTNKEFLRFASKTVAQYKKYLATASTLYNDGGYLTFTTEDRLKFIANTEFSKSLDAYLYSDTYHNEFVNLPGYEEVAFWQGTGTNNGDRLKINVTIDDGEGGTETIVQDGVVAVMFDRDAAAVCNQNYRVTSIYNPRGEYFNYFYKFDAMYMNDVLENVVVFVIADETAEEGTPANFNVAGETDALWGVDPDSYQSVSVVGNAISGTLTKDTATDAWTTKWGTGYYIALKFSGSAATTDVSVGLIPTAGTGFLKLDNDKNALFYLGNYAAGTTLTKKLGVRVGGKLYEYTLSGLTLA